MNNFQRVCASAVLLVTVSSPTLGFAQSSSGIPTSFKDLTSKDFGYDSVMALVAKGTFKGFSDGTFRPNQPVNRAEAIKILSSEFVKADDLSKTDRSDYTDIKNDAWYLPYVLWAAKTGLIDPATKNSKFRPDAGITRAEFLKMMFKVYKADTNAFGEILLPLSTDVMSSKDWYYPVMRFGLSSSVVLAPKSGLLTPAKALTRVEVAVLLQRYQLYRTGARTQVLLDQARIEIENTLDALEKNDLKRADMTSARALLAARGAGLSMPDEKPVKVAIKTAEAIRALVRAYRAAVDRKFADVIKISQDAYFIAEQARQISPDASTIAAQIEKYAKNFADTARKAQK